VANLSQPTLRRASLSGPDVGLRRWSSHRADRPTPSTRQPVATRASVASRSDTRTADTSVGARPRHRTAPGTGARLVRVMDVRSKEHCLTRIAWRLWRRMVGRSRLRRKLLTRAARSLDNKRDRGAARRRRS
jgi:hypothetical protein